MAAPDVSSITDYGVTAQDGFSTSLSSNINAAATTIVPNATTGYSDGDRVFWYLDPGESNEEVVYGEINSGQLINVVRGVVGSAQPHTSSAVIAEYVSSAHIEVIREFLETEHNADGTHSAVTANSINVTDLTVSGTFTQSGVAADGWTATGGTHSVSTGYNAGNRSFNIATSTDISGNVSPGMRYRVTRGTTPPTQCTSLTAASSQYASKTLPTGISFTNNFVMSAKVKLSSYATGGIISRQNGTSGWDLIVNSSGQLVGRAFNGGAGNSFNLTSFQSLPLNKWVTVICQMDMTVTTNSPTTNYITIDGADAPATATRAGTNPTSLVQAGNLQIGATNSGSFFSGKISDARVWSAKRTQLQGSDDMYNYPSVTTNLVAHFKLNGDFNDSSSNANNLTASGGAVATDSDNPWNATEYGIITKVTSSAIQVFCPEGYGIPNETLTTPFYSTQSAPYGFPRGESKWVIERHFKTDEAAKTITSFAQWYGHQISIPIGDWSLGWEASVQCGATTNNRFYTFAMSASTTDESEDNLLTAYFRNDNNFDEINSVYKSIDKTLTAQTTYYIITKVNAAQSHSINGSEETCVLFARCAYL